MTGLSLIGIGAILIIVAEFNLSRWQRHIDNGNNLTARQIKMLIRFKWYHKVCFSVGVLFGTSGIICLLWVLLKLTYGLF